jgi:hypothetical protein
MGLGMAWCGAAEVASVGPLQRSDVPLSAVDFHVSSILEELLREPRIRAAACNASDAGHDLQEALQQVSPTVLWVSRMSARNAIPTKFCLLASPACNCP